MAQLLFVARVLRKAADLIDDSAGQSPDGSQAARMAPRLQRCHFVDVVRLVCQSANRRMQKIGLNLLCVCVSAVQVSPVCDCCCHFSCCPVPFSTHGPISSQPVPSFHATLEETATIGLLLHSKNNSEKLQLVDVLCFNWTQRFCLWKNFINRHDHSIAL